MTLPGAVTADDDAARRAARRTAKVTAVLHDGHPVRFWDHDLGPDRPRLLAAPPAGRRPPGLDRPHPRRRPGARGGRPRRHPGRVDGRHHVARRRAARRRSAARSSAATPPAPGRPRVLLDDPGHTVDGPVAVSPDGRWVACIRERRTTATGRRTAVRPRTRRRRRTAGGRARLGPLGQRLSWTPDAAALVVDRRRPGRAPLFRVDLRRPADTSPGSRATTAPTPTPSSPPTAPPYALRSAVDAPPAPGPPRPAKAAQCPDPRHPCPRRPPHPRCRAPSPRSPPPPRTARRCAPGSCSPTARRPPPPRRCCCGSTAAR